MIFDEKGKAHIECETCFNRVNLNCPCVILSGNTDLPNLFNVKFPETNKIHKINKSKSKKENIYEAKL